MRGFRHRHSRGDVAPGYMDAPDRHNIRQGVFGYLLGLVLATLLTLASFYTVQTSLIWGPAIPSALVVFAVAQIGVHLVFFLHLTSAPDNTNNILALAFGVLIVGLIIAGSIYIMYHLDTRLMSISPHQMMQMQR